ncbi:hypothetical protein QE152_g19667 [Popillia japonica]|uniref:Uncharacterized protein n=1 Tax=Popillia japonica TaxID=7064 RepID=A0AAW1KQE5_POPJA
MRTYVIAFFAILAVANSAVVAPVFYSGAYPTAGLAYVATPLTASGYPLLAPGSGLEGQYIPDITEKLFDDGSYRPEISEKLFDDGSYRGE